MEIVLSAFFSVGLWVFC